MGCTPLDTGARQSILFHRTFNNVAIVMHPEMKYKYFESEWKSQPDWISSAKQAVNKLWNEEYHTEPPLQISTALEPMNDEPGWKRKKRARLTSDLQDELTWYLEKDLKDNVKNPLKYWVLKKKDP